VQGRNCLTQFHGMDLTTDKLRSLVRKWQTLIEAHVDVKTTDGYFLRLFCISFTKKRPGQVKKTAYAQSSQVRRAACAGQRSWLHACSAPPAACSCDHSSRRWVAASAFISPHAAVLLAPRLPAAAASARRSAPSAARWLRS
jgi:hypothetical protein